MKQAVILVVLLAMGCSGGKPVAESAAAQRPVMVYRTTGDFYDKVPVGLDAERQRIVSYPAPGDLWQAGNPKLPVRLAKGYLMDRQGVGANAAFLGIDYATYGAKEHAPSLATMEAALLERAPFAELYDCRAAKDEAEIMRWAERGQLAKRCKVLIAAPVR